MSSSSETNLYSAESLIPILHTAFTDPGEAGNQARRLLDKLQNRPEAWSISALLTQPALDANVRFYAASTLKHKVIYDLRQLSEEEIEALQSFLIQTPVGERMVQVQMQLAVAALLVQLPSCEQAVGELTAQGNFGLLGMIPEQTRNRMIPKKYAISQPTVQLVLDRFLGVLREGSDDQVILEGLGNWMELATEDGGAISSPHLLRILFNLLVDGEDSVGEVLSNVVYLNSVRTPGREWLEMLGNGLLGLSRSEEVDLRWAVEVMAEAAASHLDFILANREALLPPVELTLMRGVSNRERPITEATLGTWDALSDHPGLEELFHALFRALITGPHLRYPPGFNSREELDDFRDFRHVIGDTLKTCVRYLGSTEALQVILEHLNNNNDNQEALLFVMRTIASAVDRRETEVLPRILSVLLHPSNPSGEDDARLRYAKNLVIGCYADWANAQGRPVVQELCRYLFSSFERRHSNSTSENEDVLVSAAMALMFMAESNARYFPLELLSQLERLLSEQVVLREVKVRGYLCEALGIVHAANQTYSGFVSRVFLPVLQITNDFDWIECYGRMMDALKANDFWEDPMVVQTHLDLVTPVLLSLPIFDEAYLDALCAELLPPNLILEVVRRGYLQRRKPYSLKLLLSINSLSNEVAALLKECADTLIAEDVFDFVRVLGHFRGGGGCERTVVTACLSDPEQARECAPHLIQLLPIIPTDLLLLLIRLALTLFSPGSLGEVAHQLWKGKRAGALEVVLRDLGAMTEVERHFWLGKVTEAEAADRSRPLKDLLLQLSDLIKRRI